MSGKISTQQHLIFFLASTLLLIAPIFRSGKTASALMTIELIGLCLLLAVMWHGQLFKKMDRGAAGFILLGLTALAIYLIPLPANLWHEIPGRDLYGETIAWVASTTDIQPYLALSLVPLNTFSVLVACIPITGLFIATATCPERQLKWLVHVLLFSATLQASLGLIQYLTNDPYFYFGIQRIQGVQGTYLNRNHFTAFMEMAEPMALALMIYAIIEPSTSKIHQIGRVALYAALSLLLTFVAFTTTSRMGTGLLLLSIILSFWVMKTPGFRQKVAPPVLLLRLSLLALVIFAQYKMISTFSTTASEMSLAYVLGDLRYDLFLAAWEAVKTFFPFGSGPGTMPQILPAYLPADNALFQTTFVNHVHNDYLELFMEMGIIGLLITLSFLGLYLRQWFSINRSDHNEIRLLKSGAGVSIFLILIFGLTDFNLHTPANVVFFVFLCGVFFRKSYIEDSIPITDPSSSLPENS